jgi:hypothetical protein
MQRDYLRQCVHMLFDGTTAAMLYKAFGRVDWPEGLNDDYIETINKVRRQENPRARNVTEKGLIAMMKRQGVKLERAASEGSSRKKPVRGCSGAFGA